MCGHAIGEAKPAYHRRELHHSGAVKQCDNDDADVVHEYTLWHFFAKSWIVAQILEIIFDDMPSRKLKMPAITLMKQ